MSQSLEFNNRNIAEESVFSDEIVLSGESQVGLQRRCGSGEKMSVESL